MSESLLQICLVGFGVPVATLLLNRLWKVIDEKKAKDGVLMKKLNAIEKKLDDHIAADDERDAVQHRVRIQRFESELRMNGFNCKTKEEYDQFIADCTAYNAYCKAHPTFSNDVTVLAEEHGKACYKKCLDTNGFLK